MGCLLFIYAQMLRESAGQSQETVTLKPFHRWKLRSSMKKHPLKKKVNAKSCTRMVWHRNFERKKFWKLEMWFSKGKVEKKYNLKFHMIIEYFILRKKRLIFQNHEQNHRKPKFCDWIWKQLLIKVMNYVINVSQRA